MTPFLAGHSRQAFLKPGEVIVTAEPVLVSTILGSCVAVTLYAPDQGIGAICHAILPDDPSGNNDLRHVGTAVRAMYEQIQRYRPTKQLVVKLFGGAQVLACEPIIDARLSVGAQNIRQARQTLEQLGLGITNADTGGNVGRKVLFSIKTGDVYVRKLRHRDIGCTCVQGRFP